MNMSGFLILGSFAIFALLFTWAIRTPSRWETLIQKASSDGHIEPLLEELKRRPELLRPRFYDEAMHKLIDTNQDVAAQFTMAFVPTFPDNKHCQEWLSRLESLEPRPPLLSTSFLEQYTRSHRSSGAG